MTQQPPHGPDPDRPDSPDPDRPTGPEGAPGDTPPARPPEQTPPQASPPGPAETPPGEPRGKPQDPPPPPQGPSPQGPPPQGPPPQSPGGSGHPAQAGPAPTVPPLTAGEEQGWSIGAHLGGFVAGFIPALVIWLVFRERSRMVDDHAKEALNFQITLLIAYVVGMVTTFVGIGVLILFAAWVCAIVFGILASVAANRRQPYRYPLSIRLIT